MSFYGKRVFADVIKDLEMRSSWMNRVGPKSDGKCPYKTQKSRDTDRREAHVVTEAETGVSGHKPKNAGSHQELEEAREHSPPEPSEGARPSQHLDVRLLTSRSLDCLKPSSLWYFVRAATENPHSR